MASLGSALLALACLHTLLCLPASHHSLHLASSRTDKYCVQAAEIKPAVKKLRGR